MEKKIETIGERIKSLRELNGITQSKLGEELFVSDKTISKWEKGKSEPESAVLVKLSKLFKVTLDYLLTGSEAPIEKGTVTQLEQACREDNIALLMNIDLTAYDLNGKNIEFYIKKYKCKNIGRFYSELQHLMTMKEDIIQDKYFIIGLSKDTDNPDDYKILAHGGPLNKAQEECSKYEEKGYHDFQVLRRTDVNEKSKIDYQFFFAHILDDSGQCRATFSTSAFDKSKAGLLHLNIYRLDTYDLEKKVDGKLVPDYHPKSKTLLDCHYYVKPAVFDEYLKLLGELDIKNWENRHWGVPFTSLFYTLVNESKDDNLACHKFYVAPGKEAYTKFANGVIKMLLETLSPSAFKKFTSVFEPGYYPYYRENLPYSKSCEIFREIEKEMLEIKKKELIIDEY